MSKWAPATRKIQRLATGQEAIFGKIMADKDFMRKIDGKKMFNKRRNDQSQQGC